MFRCVPCCLRNTHYTGYFYWGHLDSTLCGLTFHTCDFSLCPMVYVSTHVGYKDTVWNFWFAFNVWQAQLSHSFSFSVDNCAFLFVSTHSVCLYFHPVEKRNESSLSLLKSRSMSYKNISSLFIVCTLFSINTFSIGFLDEDPPVVPCCTRIQPRASHC